MIRRVVLVLVLLSLSVSISYCDRPVIPALKTEVPPVIDGDLSDECWKTAPSVTDFFFLPDQSEAPEETTAWICYDDKYIYVAFYCRDSQPDRIVAQQKKRGGNIDTDDWVALDLDCFNDFQHLIWFDVTARGVQVDRLHSGDAANIRWRGDWKAAAKRVDDGYVVEMAIPFSILQYDAGQTKMGIAFIRKHARHNQMWWSPNMGPTFDMRRFYIWEGLDLPKPENRPLVLGYTLFGAGGSGDAPQRAGLDIKHAITPSLNGLLTVNPDFRSIEQDVDSVDFSYTERFVSDSRPFFLEGPGYFPRSNILYTRRIRDIDAGTKLSGRIGDYDLAFMRTERFGTENHTVLQLGYHWEDRTSLWLCGIDSRTPDVSNRVTQTTFVHRHRLPKDRQIRFSSTYATADAASGDGVGALLYASVYNVSKPRELSFSMNYQSVDSDYDPYLGLVGDKGIRRWTLNLSTFDEPSTGTIQRWNGGIGLERADRLDGTMFYDWLSFFGQINLRNGARYHLNWNKSHRPPHRDSVTRIAYSWGGRDLYRRGGVNLGSGKLASGDYRYGMCYQGWQISDRLSMRGSYEYAHIKDPSPRAFLSRQAILSAAYDLDYERTVGARMVRREGKSNLYFAYRQRVRAGMDAYLIYGDPNAEETKNTVLVKLVRPLL